MSENLRCNVCSGEISEEDLILLKIQKKIECRYCKNLIVIDEESSTLKEDLICIICGGSLTADDLNNKASACKYCQNSLEEISYSEANYPEIFKKLKEIPYEKIVEVYNLLTREEVFDQLNEEQQKQLKLFSESLIPKMKEIYNANKWKVVANAIAWLGKRIGTLVGFAVIGGTVGVAVGSLVAVIGSKLIKSRSN